MKKAVLFVDDHNSFECQIAELYLNQFYGDSYEVYSAGLSPTQINPYLHEAMIEEGIDVSDSFAKEIDHFKGLEIDLVVKILEKDVDLSSFFSGAEFLKTNFRDHYVERESDDENFAEITKIKYKIIIWCKDKFGIQNISKYSNKVDF